MVKKWLGRLIENINIGAGEHVQKVRVLVTLPDGCRSVPSTHVGQLATTAILASEGTHMSYTHIRTHTHEHEPNKN